MSLDARRATSLVLESGKSPELTAVLAAIAEATAPDGAPRYDRRTCRRLSRLVVTRTYPAAVLQLCHLLVLGVAATGRPDGPVRLFLGTGRATAAGFRGWLAAVDAGAGWRRPGVDLAGGGAVLRYDDGVFNVRFGAMPLLAALYEFLCATVGYPALEDAARALDGGPRAMTAVSAAARGLERALYAWLRDHLPGVESARNFDAILAFLAARADAAGDVGDGTAAGNTGDGASVHGAGGDLVADDAALLAFWCDPDAAGIASFRTFRSVFDAFMAFLASLDAARDGAALARAVPIGTDRAAGEVDPGDLDAAAGAAFPGAAPVPPLDVLRSPPADRVRFLTGTEADAVADVAAHGARARALPLSVLRVGVFGAVQARLTEARRRRVDPAGLGAIVDAGMPAGDDRYAGSRAALAAIGDRLDRVLRAALHLLLRAGAPDGIGGSGEDRSDGDGEIRLPDVAGADHAADGAPSVDPGRLAAARAEALAAYRRLNRRGFTAAEADDPGVVEGLRAGVGAVHEITALVRAFLGVLDRVDGDGPGLAGWYRRDRAVFAARFAELYGFPDGGFPDGGSRAPGGSPGGAA